MATILEDVKRFSAMTAQQAAWFTAVRELADVSMSLDYDDLTEAQRAQLVTRKRELMRECDRLQALAVGEVTK